MTVSQAANDVLSRARQGLIGAWVLSSALNSSITVLNEDPQAVQVDTIQVDTATNDHEYEWTINSVDLTFTADSSATKIEISDGMALVTNADPLVRGQVKAVADGTDLITLTGLTPGQAFTLTDVDSKCTDASVTTAAAASALGFGRAVIADGTNTNETEQLGKAVVAAAFTAQVITLNMIFVTSATYLLTLRTSTGDLLSQIEVDANTNTDTTAAAIVTALNDDLAASTILTVQTAGVITLTAEVPGTEFTLEVGVNEEGGAGDAIVSVVATTGPSQATSLERALLGVTLHSDNDPTTTIGGTEGSYAANAGMRVARRGVVWVESTETITADSDVYVETTAGTTAGRFFAASSATRIKLPRSLARWERDGITASDTLAALRLSL